MRRTVALLIAVLLLCLLPLSAAAHDVPQDREDCSITISVSYGGNPVKGGTLTIVRVGYIDEDDGNYFFRRVYDDQLLTDVQSATAAKELLDFVNGHNTVHKFLVNTVPVVDGKATFQNLPTGLYLVAQNKAASGYSKLAPFLVSLPYLDDQGVYQYQLTANAKSELEQIPETKPYTPVNPGPWLPQTGQLNWPVPVMACAGMVLFAAGWFLCFRGRRKYDSKD